MKAEKIGSADDLEAWLNGLPEDQRMSVAIWLMQRHMWRHYLFWFAKAFSYSGERLPKFDIFRNVAIASIIERLNRKSIKDTIGDNQLIGPSFIDQVASIKKEIESTLSDLNDDEGTGSDNDLLTELSLTAHSGFLGAISDLTIIAGEMLSLRHYSPKLVESVCLMARRGFNEIKLDCFYVEEDNQRSNALLWPDGVDVFDESLQQIRTLPTSHVGWTPLVDIYENAHRGKSQNINLLRALAAQDVEFWQGAENEVLDRITEVMEGFALAAAIPFDYNFDQIARMMRIVGIGDDAAHLRDPKANRRFLDDAEEARDRLQDFVEYTANMGGGSNTAGVTRVAAEKLLDELRRIEDLNHLRVRMLMDRAKSLEMFMGDPQHAGDLSAPLITILADAVTGLRGVFRTHFGPAFAALAPLSQLSWDQLDQDAVLALFDRKIEDIQAIRSEDAPLDPEGQAILADMLRELHEWRARIAEASSDEMRHIYEARFAEATGSTGLALVRFVEKRAPHIGQASDAIIKGGKTLNGLKDIVDAVGLIPPS